MGRYKIFIALLLSFFSFFSASAYAITDAEMAAIRQQRAQAEYAAAVRAQIERYDQSVEYKANRNALSNQINGTVSAAETISDGSKVSSVSTISKAADAAKAAGTVAARYGKAALRGAPASFLGYAAFEGLMKGAGYVMGDGSKVVKKPFLSDSDSVSATLQNAWHWSDIGYYNSASSACNAVFNYAQTHTTYNSARVVTAIDKNGAYATCYLYDSNNSLNTLFTVAYQSNPNYNSALQQTYTTATQQDIQKAIQNYLKQNPTSNITNNIYLDAYSPDKTFSLSDESVNGLSSQIAKQVSDNLASAAQSPTGRSSTTLADGTQVDTSIDTTGKTATGSSTSTTTNPDGTTTTTTTTSSSQLPAFCSWASIVCDWYTWTKTTYDSVVSAVTDFFTLDNSDTTVQVDDSDSSQDQDFSSDISFGSQCPAPVTLINSSFMGVPINWQYDFSDFCTILSDYVRPILIAMGAFIAALIIGGVRTTDD